MKKFFVLILMIMLFVPTVANAYFLYEEPSGLIIAQPAINSTTTAAKSSIYGAGTWDEPVYLNGKKIATTEHGFFAEYVDLVVGKNVFKITQGSDEKTVTITRQSTSSSGSSSSIPVDYLAKVKYYDTAKYGVVTSENGTHRQLPDGSKNLLNALAKGTKVQVLGEYGDYYCLGDKTFIYKTTMKIYDGEMAVNPVKSVTVTPLNDGNCTEVNLKIDNTYYEVAYAEGKILLTVWYANSSAKPVYQDNPVFEKINVIAKDNKVTYEFILKETAAINGHYVEFNDGSDKDGYMIFGIKNQPYLNSELQGATVFLDAGHGGKDPGALGAAGAWGLTEAQINLVITNYAKDYLESKGATVVTTRTDDTYSSLQSRLVNILNSKPDLAISIHTNSNATSSDYSSISGLRTYYTYEVGNNAKNLISKAVCDYMDMAYKKPILSNLALTRQQSTSAILIEHGYMSNPNDYELMLTSEYQKAMGEAIGKATEDYLLFVALTGENPYEISMFEDAIMTDPNSLDITVFVDGQKVAYDVLPTTINDSTMVPLRATFEALNAEVNWDNETKSITAISGDTKIYMALDSDVMKISSQNEPTKTFEKTLLSPPVVVGERTLVPIRAISESFDCTVDWEAKTKQVKISTIED